MEPIIKEISSGLPGPTTLIMGGVHGNESTGVAVVSKLMNSLNIVCGTVILCLAHPLAIEKNIRQVEYNLNRLCMERRFPGFEGDIAEILKPLIERSGYLLDLHNTTIPGSQPFLISEHSELDDLFDVEYVVSGLDVLHPGGTDGYANSVGTVGLCLECGSIYEEQEKSICFATNTVMNFLKYVGNIDGDPMVYGSVNRVVANEIYHTKTDNFRLTRAFNDFESLERGTIIGNDGGRVVFAPYDGVIVFPYNQYKVGQEGFVYGKKVA